MTPDGTGVRDASPERSEGDGDAGDDIEPGDGGACSDGEEGASVAPMLAVYRHDVHKLRGRPHDSAAEEFAGVRVNEPVPQGADADAALLSRPRGEPERTVANHASPYRLSLVSGSSQRAAASQSEHAAAIRELVRVTDPAEAHRAWLGSRVAARISESVYYPYTSVKYHVLLAAALLSNYRGGASFDELFLVVDRCASPASAEGGAAGIGDDDGVDAVSCECVVPHRTVFCAGSVALRVSADPQGRPAASVGGVPARSWADVWTRLPAQPLPVDERRWARVVDAQLRRIRSWSVALQFLEECLVAAPKIHEAGTGTGTGRWSV